MKGTGSVSSLVKGSSEPKKITSYYKSLVLDPREGVPTGKVEQTRDYKSRLVGTGGI